MLTIREMDELGVVADTAEYANRTYIRALDPGEGQPGTSENVR